MQIIRAFWNFVWCKVLYASKLCCIFGFLKIFSNYFSIFLIHCAASKRKTKVTSIRFLWSIIAMTSGEASAKLSFTLTSKNCSWEKCPKQLLNFWIMKMLYGGVSVYIHIFCIVRQYSIFLEVDTLWKHTEKVVKKLTIKMYLI